MRLISLVTFFTVFVFMLLPQNRSAKATSPAKSDVTAPSFVEIKVPDIGKKVKEPKTPLSPPQRVSATFPFEAKGAAAANPYAETAEWSRKVAGDVLKGNAKFKSNKRVTDTKPQSQEAVLVADDAEYTIRVEIDKDDRPTSLFIAWHLVAAPTSDVFEVTDENLKGEATKLKFPNGSLCYESVYRQLALQSCLRTCISVLGPPIKTVSK